MTPGELLSGGQIVARTLRALGADTIFSVSGNQVLPIFDAVGDAGLRLIHLRHESAAAYAALGFAETSGRPGVVLVSAGPGFLAAATGLATAKSAEVPLLFLSGAAAVPEQGAGGFQDLDQTSVAGVIGKGSLPVRSAGELRPALLEAWRLANADVPGPVHVSLPSDVLRATVTIDLAESDRRDPPFLLGAVEPTLAAMAERLARASRPLIVARPSANRGPAGRALWRLARNLVIEPVITESPRGVGDLKYEPIIAQYPQSDCALVLGPADFAVGFLSESAIATHGALLHIDSPNDPRSRRVPTLGLQMPVEPALEYLAAATTNAGRQPNAWSDLWSKRPLDPLEAGSPAGLHPLEVAHEVRELLRPDDVIVLDGGEYCQWIRLGLRDVPNRVLWNAKLGGIGGGVPLALGVAAAGHPGRTIACVGDGAFGYHAAELETAARYGFPLVVIVGNDGRWGAEWHLQVSRYGADRAFETTLLPADYDVVARGLGALGNRVADVASLREALAAAVGGRRPVCINAQIQSIRSPAITH